MVSMLTTSTMVNVKNLNIEVCPNRSPLTGSASLHTYPRQAQSENSKTLLGDANSVKLALQHQYRCYMLGKTLPEVSSQPSGRIEAKKSPKSPQEMFRTSFHIESNVKSDHLNESLSPKQGFPRSTHMYLQLQEARAPPRAVSQEFNVTDRESRSVKSADAVVVKPTPGKSQIVVPMPNRDEILHATGHYDSHPRSIRLQGSAGLKRLLRRLKGTKLQSYLKLRSPHEGATLTTPICLRVL